MFADEAGCFTFNRNPNVSRYFIICTVTTTSLDVGIALITAASIGTKKERNTFTNALADVMLQTIGAIRWKIDFRPSHCDPCLQLADYCAWALQRKWERGDLRSYDLIKDRITYEYELWKHGSKLYY